jgi:hypothetical protein
MGSVETKEDSIVIFPNAFQHHVDPFDLQHPSKPGHRKILCFFICRPENNHIVSTDKVPRLNSKTGGQKISMTMDIWESSL